jgi:hypothetical protein
MDFERTALRGLASASRSEERKHEIIDRAAGSHDSAMYALGHALGKLDSVQREQLLATLTKYDEANGRRL